MRRTLRQKRRGLRRKGGDRKKTHRVRFPNNLPLNSEPTHTLPNTYLEDLKFLLQLQRAPVSNTHLTNAQIMSVVQSANDPATMREILFKIYNPQPLTPEESAIARSFISKVGLQQGINRAAIAPLDEEMRERILNYLRYAQAVRKIEHTYEKEHVPNPKYVHAEWNSQT